MSAVTASPRTVDCRALPPHERQAAFLSAFDALGGGEALVLVSDHAPRPILALLQAQRPGLFEWSPLEEGPGTWRTEIARRASAGPRRDVTEALAWDHDRLDDLEGRAFAARAAGDFARAAATYAVFAHGLRRHIGFEEKVLFPEFESRSGISPVAGPTAVMRAEHEEIQALIAEIERGIGDPAAAVDGPRARLHRVLGDHNLKEEGVLYPGTDRLLTPAERDDLVKRIQAFSA